ncbi:hypothetical protein C3941_12180 [Kaistia algarum]|uniref:tetratricopeptide repeat protein n=1 Tax=Kaistia algarum TaxID=2083279 RepID=UPI000CE791C1|nr:tetratricopeptide repeat protein [Kaistia algarum]MCX5515105.1 tetratricopeptide repeat protein [Kaistia algarum]PPE79833.1 hypothetical protein C3941_12180 [Kaistia algarum]
MSNPASSLQATFAKAVGAYNAGQLAEAERNCRLVLSARPNVFDARYLLALIQAGLGQHKQAVESFDKALSMKPGVPELLSAKATSLQQLGRHADAVAAYDKALAANPKFAEGYFNRGTALESLGRHEEALASYERAIAVRPNFAEAYNNRGIRLQELGRFDDAMASFDKALAFAPRHVAFLHNKGRLLRVLGRQVEAIAFYDRAVASGAAFPELWISRAVALQDLGRTEEALASFDRAIALRPDDVGILASRASTEIVAGRPADALATLDRASGKPALSAEYHALRGNALYELDRYDEAVDAYDRALALAPNHAGARTDRANALRLVGRQAEALRDYSAALRIDPASDEAIYGRGTLLLSLGRFQEGWPDFERRRAMGGWEKREFSTPEWDGSEVFGRTLLVHAEQGLGDTIQFSRFVKLLQGRGGKVILEVQPPLRAILSSLGNVTVVGRAEKVPLHDMHVPVMSLPYMLHAGSDVAPGGVPYLTADPKRVEAWRDRLPPGRLRIGIAWQGNPNAKVDRVRSVPLRAFAPLAALPDVTLISLQKGHGLEQLADLPAVMRVETLPDDFATGPDSFMDTAAVMMNLDLIVSIDSAVTHLAGALGRPVFVALKHSPEWRWMEGREDSPWYPTARLFLQKRDGEWDEVLERIAAAAAERFAGGQGTLA